METCECHGVDKKLCPARTVPWHLGEALGGDPMVTQFKNNKEMNRWALTSQCERAFEWLTWFQKIPYIPFPSGWEVMPAPPFSGAITRFRVRKQGTEVPYVSVYLDCYDLLGFVGKPYWELYPAKNGDTERYLMDDVKGLVEGLTNALA